MKKHYLVGITSALGAALWMFGPISHVVSVTGKQLVRDFYFLLLEHFVVFLLFKPCSAPLLLYFLAIMEIQHWWKMLKWNLKSFICFFISIVLFYVDKFATNHWLVWKHCTSSLLGGFARVLSLLFWFCVFCQLQINSPGRKMRAEDIPGLWGSICFLLLLAGLHNGEDDPRSSLSLGRSMQALRDEKQSWSAGKSLIPITF